MLATFHTMLTPDATVDVQPIFDVSTPHQRYILILRDGLSGTVELVFPSAEHLRLFLRNTRDALSAARCEVQARKARFRPQQHRVKQITLF